MYKNRYVFSVGECRHLGKKSRLEIIKDAGHALQLEGADKVNSFIKSFFLDERNEPGFGTT